MTEFMMASNERGRSIADLLTAGVLFEVAKERKAQVERGYTTAQDDAKGIDHLLAEIHFRAKKTSYLKRYAAGDRKLRSELVKVAALATAGIELLDREEAVAMQKAAAAAFLDPETLEDRRIYKLQSRNLLEGVYVAEKQGFIGIRRKFDSEFLFMEYEWSTSETTGTARARLAMDMVPPEVNLVEYIKTDKQLAVNQPLFDILAVLQKTREDAWKAYVDHFKLEPVAAWDSLYDALHSLRPDEFAAYVARLIADNVAK